MADVLMIHIVVRIQYKLILGRQTTTGKKISPPVKITDKIWLSNWLAIV